MSIYYSGVEQSGSSPASLAGSQRFKSSLRNYLEEIMIYKRCPHCGKRIESGTTCKCRKREYQPPSGIYKLYHTQRWRDLRAVIMAKYNGIDLWALHQHGRLEYAETVHHIVPTSDDEGLFFVFSNLIPVSRASHDEIHMLYKTDKEATQKILIAILSQEGIG